MAYPTIDTTAPDNDAQVLCPGAQRLTLQISNQAVLITFGTGNPPRYDETPEPYLPIVGEIVRPFDAFKYRAKIPAAQLPAGATQANIKAIIRTT